MGKCSEAGVLGPVVGVIGSMQAMETVKILAGMDGVCGLDALTHVSLSGTLSGRLYVYDALRCTSRTVQLRARNPTCSVCGDAASAVPWPHTDYVQFCGVPACDSVRYTPMQPCCC